MEDLLTPIFDSSMEGRLASKKERKGLIQVFTGTGKGKTSAALGAILRATGHGFRVFIVFFMKGKYPYGEFSSLPKLPNVEVASFGLRCLIGEKEINPEEIKQAELALKTAREAMLSGKYDLVVLDEVNVALNFKLIPLDDVIKLIEEKPPQVELILTGRYAQSAIIERADLVTEMMKIKHPYDRGIKARKGIEY
jgi:cob(I)alamin adenosyltransferase